MFEHVDIEQDGGLFLLGFTESVDSRSPETVGDLERVAVFFGRFGLGRTGGAELDGRRTGVIRVDGDRSIGVLVLFLVEL